MSQELGADPSIIKSFEHYEDQIEPKKLKVIKVGMITRKEGKIYYMPLVQNPMAFEWWTLTGKTEELIGKLIENKPGYCKLKGIQEMTKVLHRKRKTSIMGYRDVFYTFAIEDILWIKSKEEILRVKVEIDELIKEADTHFRTEQYEEALPLFERARSLAKEFLPNAVSFGVLEKEKRCREISFITIQIH